MTPEQNTKDWIRMQSWTHGHRFDPERGFLHGIHRVRDATLRSLPCHGAWRHRVYNSGR